MAGLVNSDPLPCAQRGSLICMLNNGTYLLPPGNDGMTLICQANAPSGAGLAWTLNPSFDNVSAALLSVTEIVGGRCNLSGGFSVYGATPPAQAAFPGTATGTDAAVINAIVAFLAAYGFCASS
jgi:hypothetical protein